MSYLKPGTSSDKCTSPDIALHSEAPADVGYQGYVPVVCAVWQIAFIWCLYGKYCYNPLSGVSSLFQIMLISSRICSRSRCLISFSASVFYQALLPESCSYQVICVTVNQGYMAKIDDTNLRHLVPPTLREHRSIMFTNISEIHEFHARQVTCLPL